MADWAPWLGPVFLHLNSGLVAYFLHGVKIGLSAPENSTERLILFAGQGGFINKACVLQMACQMPHFPHAVTSHADSVRF